PDPQGASRWLARARELGFFNTLNSGTQKAAAAAQKGAAAARPGPPSSLLPAAQLTDPAVRREALWLAASDGDVASLEALVDPALVVARDEFGRGALARAAEAASAPAVALLGMSSAEARSRGLPRRLRPPPWRSSSAAGRRWRRPIRMARHRS